MLLDVEPTLKTLKAATYLKQKQQQISTNMQGMQKSHIGRVPEADKNEL